MSAPRRNLPLRFIGRRLLQALLTILGIAIINFFLLQLAPGDAADALAGEAGTADAEYLANLRREFGLDRPLWEQLAAFLMRIATFNLGYSFRYGENVSTLILGRLPASLLLMVASILIALMVGVIFGVTAARYFNRLPDRLISLLALLFYATPPFWIGLMMIVVFSVWLGWAPTGGMRDITAQDRGFAGVLDVLRHLALPALTQAFFYLAIYTRLVRAGMLEVMSLDYIRVARAKGVSEQRIVYRHALRNAVLPLITVVGTNIGGFLGGAVLTETVFSWPGIGRLMFDAMMQRDLNLLLSILVLSSVFVVLANLVVDLIYPFINPTVELR
ncbi:MAG: ABC transporter permease [Chelatococcus sp.]|jgi:peptide/nickel transport system permease protein|uniref:ABC transporter permease n=1 Tax=unclassified Chelatococcus TaxID=2638111 RepID=UPI001BD0BB7C|nr:MULTISPECIES: ABC transporter permease [unclassified Chelatococcus]CAH1657887.1 Peptide/nickel transport system permease protein [Hyphomicrobiales bacterium]MBS7742246.1 ABC transporter permease [Chelatococcus sp. HY11]MBX3537418.1 ABC transporter permease [Chelatococcus sp.]MBX3542636.1 ABC transporter permease [Chelatococcus sp.]MCO5075148.1 ABC transporter permease [Chelatococcus sp.]